MLEKMDKEVEAFEDNLIRISWIMRGMSLNEVYSLSPSQRETINKLYQSNLETTQKSGLPFF